MAEVKLENISTYDEKLEQTITMLYGHILESIELGKVDKDDIIIFNLANCQFALMHDRSCCESVKFINQDIIVHKYKTLPKSNNFIIKQIKLNSNITKNNDYDSVELTTLLLFLENEKTDEYQILLFSWLGISNGWYSTGIDLFRIDSPGKHGWENSNIEDVKVLWKSLE